MPHVRVTRPSARSAAAIGVVVGALFAGHVQSADASPRLEIGAVRTATKTAPLVLSVQAPRSAELKLRVGGRPVADAFDYAGRRIHVAHLSLSDGLSPGRNRIRVRADRNGEASAKQIRVDVPRRALFADAGTDTGTLASAGVQVGAAPVGLGATPGLRRSWRVVARPDDAEFALRHRHQAQPVLKAATVGTYVLRVKTRRRGHPGASHDTVTVPVSPVDPPIGAPISPLGGGTGDIVIGGRSYGSSSDQTPVTYAVLERTTRAVVESGSVATDAAGMARLSSLADTYGTGTKYLRYIMVVNSTEGIPGPQQAAFSSVLKRIGSPLLTPDQFKALTAGVRLFVAGVPGAAAGAATTCIPCDPRSGRPISGYLQKNQAISVDGTPVYDLVFPEHPSFDTRAPGSDDKSNVMTVGDQTYDARLSSDETAGFHILVLESLSLTPLVNYSFGTNGYSTEEFANDRERQADAAADIQTALRKSSDATVFVQSIGNPQGAGPEWQKIVDEFRRRLGANAQVLNALNAEHEDSYALVSRIGSDQPPAEASTPYDLFPPQVNPPARLVGMLSRTRSSTFEPTVSSTPSAANPAGTVNLELTRIAYQTAQDWPELAPDAPAGEADAAETYVCKQLNFCQATDSCPDVRSCYWQRYSADWGQKYAELLALQYPGPTAGFSSSTFNAVKGELLKEISAVSAVQKYMDRLQAAFVPAEVHAYVHLQKISEDVFSSVKPPANDNSTAWILGLISKAALLGEALGPPASHGAAGISAVMGLAAYLSDKQAQPVLGEEIKAKTAQLGEQLVERFRLASQALDNTGMLLVSDYGKLMAAKPHFDSDWSLPTAQTIADGLQTPAKQWFYEALVPTAYPYLIRGNAFNARQLNCVGDSDVGWPNQPDEDQMQATVGYDRSGNPVRAIFFFARGMGASSSPPASIGKEMFDPSSGIQIEKLSFFTPELFGDQISHAVNGRGLCQLPFLPRYP